MRFDGDIHSEVEKRLMRLTKAELIDVMYNAVDHMQLYNGQTIQQCIVRGMGGKVNDEGMMTLPGLSKIKEYLA